MFPSHLFGVLLAIISALLYGSGDFSGGFATRRSNLFRVLALASLAGVAFLTFSAVVRGESITSWRNIVWGGLAGVSNTLGLASLYRGLAIGNAAFVAPTAAVIGAAVPVFFGAVLEGPPGIFQLVGFAAGMLGIWFVSKSPSETDNIGKQDLLMAALAGVGFGGFYVLFAQVETGSVFVPLVACKIVVFGLALAALLKRGSKLPSLGGNLVAVLAGVLDAGAGVFYVLAKQFTRMDVAAVLSSLYPVSTILLARMLLKQTASRTQWTGVLLCLIAVALIVI